MGGEIRLWCRGYPGHLRGKTVFHVDPGDIRRMADHSIRWWSATSRIYLDERQLGSADCSDHGP